MTEEQSAGKLWLASYPTDMPADIAVDGLGTLVEMFEASAARFADRTAAICFGAALSYAELGAMSRAFAAWLHGQGVAPGDRVALMMPNVPAYPVALFGALMAGATVVNVNPLYTPRELAARLDDSGARTLVVRETFAHTVAQALPNRALDRVVLAAPGDGLELKGRLIALAARHIKRAVPAYRLPQGLATRFTAAPRAGRRLHYRRPTVTQEELAFLQYTGGTTGVAKAAMLTHRNVLANVVQSQTWFRATDPDGLERTMVTALPLYHVSIPDPRDADGFAKILKRHAFTHMSGVNTLFNLFNNHPPFPTVDFARHDFVVGGGMAVQRAVAARWKAITGTTIIEGYGLSETSPVVRVNPYGLAEWSGTIGFPLPSTEVSIRGARAPAPWSARARPSSVPLGSADERSAAPLPDSRSWPRPSGSVRLESCSLRKPGAVRPPAPSIL